MPANSKHWEFRQLGGKQKVLKLTGWTAPFGRPRQGALVNAGVALRQQTVYYPGNVEPTVHIFGIEPKGWELKGRFMDRTIGTENAARDLRRSWYDFVVDGQVVRAQWGDVLSYRIVITEMDLNFESEAEIAWTLRATVLSDESQTKAANVLPVKAPLDYAVQMQVWMLALQAFAKLPPTPSLSLSSVLALLPEIADALDEAIGVINAPFAAVFDVCSALNDFQTALSSDLGKLTAGIHAMKTGILDLRDGTDLFAARAAQLNRDTASLPDGILGGGDVTVVAAAKAAADLATANLLGLIADMQNEIDKAQRGQFKTAHSAQSGDTFESIAKRTMGGSDSASAIRNMNGIRYGQKPVPGRQYTIPKGP